MCMLKLDKVELEHRKWSIDPVTEVKNGVNICICINKLGSQTEINCNWHKHELDTGWFQVEYLFKHD